MHSDFANTLFDEHQHNYLSLDRGQSFFLRSSFKRKSTLFSHTFSLPQDPFLGAEAGLLPLPGTSPFAVLLNPDANSESIVQQFLRNALSAIAGRRPGRRRSGPRRQAVRRRLPRSMMTTILEAELEGRYLRVR